MTLEKLNTILKAADYPVAYSHFNDSVKPPFITYLITDSENFTADNQIYKRIDNVNIELYTKIKDLAAEKKLEDLLNTNELVWDVSEEWIDTEKLFQRVYGIRLIYTERELI